MASIIQGLDKHTPMTVGENGHSAYDWSNDFQEKFSQFFFQLVRTSSTDTLENNLHMMLSHYSKPNPQYTSAIENITLLTKLFKMIAQTRDVIEGKGEYDLAYMQVWVWYQHYPMLAKYAIDRFFLPPTEYDTSFEKNSHPYGSWKDIKHFCEYVKQRNQGNIDHPLINHCIQRLVEQLKKDEMAMNEKNEVSLAGKWAPREKSKYGWVFKKMIMLWRPEYFETSLNTITTRKNAVKKASLELRHVLASLNTYIDTTQVKMCSKHWGAIDFNRVTSKTMNSQKKSFMNLKKNGETQRYPDDEDRNQCAENFKNHIEMAKSGDNPNVKVHGKRLDVYELVRSALLAHTQDEKDVVDLQWNDNRKKNSGLGNFIPMADTSGSMTCNNNIPIYNSIGLSIRMAELTSPAFRNRVLTFSANPEWINLDGVDSFVDKVERVSKANWGMNTDFYKAMNMILDTILMNEIPPEDVKNMVLAIFSDMQIDEASNTKNISSMMDGIKTMYHDAGLKSKFKQPYEAPHILFWNLNSTSSFPTLSTEKNVTMLSGYSSTLMNAFCEKGMDALEEFTPFRMICSILDNKRYECMERELLSYF